MSDASRQALSPRRYREILGHFATGVTVVTTACDDAEGEISTSNQSPHIFVWVATVESIMRKIAKCKEACDALH